jgi:type I restriction enzyme, S subunit
MEVKPGYKQSDVGVIPEEWDAVELNAVCSMKSGEGITAARIDQFSQYPCYGGNGLRGYTSRFTHDGSFALIGRQGALCGNVIGAEGKFFASEHAVVVTPRTGTDIRFLTYVLSEMRLNRYSESSAQPGLSVSKLLKLTRAIPPTEAEQRAIATALSDVDSLLGGLDHLIAKKRDLKQAAMQQLLTGQTRLAGFHGEWKLNRLGELASIRDGTHQTPKYVPSGVPFFSVEHVTSGDFTNTKFISEEEHRFLTRSIKIEKGDILMTRIGSIGDCKLIDWDVDASFYVSLALLKIRSGYSAAFITHYSNTAAFKKEVELHSLQSAIPKKINLGAISNVQIKLPPTLPEQTAIAEVLSDMDVELRALEQRREKTRDLKQAMMQELLTGKTRLL